MLSGTLHEVRFEWPENKEIEIENVESMKILSDRALFKGDVAYINGECFGARMLKSQTDRYRSFRSDSLGLHRVENRSHTVPAVSLHLYTPPFDKCHVFDQKTGKAAFFLPPGIAESIQLFFNEG